MNWASRAAENILPLSREKMNLASALAEWLYTGDTYDLEKPIETCELCGHPDLRYQFRIENRHNGNELLVGSECINRFTIRATDSFGRVLDENASRKKVSQDRRLLIEDARKKRLINTLLSLAKEESDFDVTTFISYEQDRGAFTPNQIGLLFWKLQEHGVEYRPSDFKVAMRRNREKDQLTDMPEWKLRKIWGAFSSSQRKWVIENTGFKP
ncbi:hypothetical protein [uncultured Marinobacter sp.]|uniref:hypothetical protein n=1 Tax=uncultured Marinobacter sp. TaxID=187379 RepID=UPI0030D8EF92|tara:strand:- start:56 stop:691 length:636 start_codon:yes stop_codon:yes gene_type:complete